MIYKCRNKLYNVEVRPDIECIWSDGNIGGYCTEFYKNDIEIGNIVNTLGTCIDIGFGLERLLLVLGLLEPKLRIEILEETSLLLIDNGIKLSHNNEGYILKKIITECVLHGSKIDNDEFNTIRDNQIKIYRNYKNLSTRNSNKGKLDDYWMHTMEFNKTKEHLYQKLQQITID